MTKGDCDLCGHWDGALAEGVCGECLERYGGESKPDSFSDVLADTPPDETLVQFAVRVVRERNELNNACSVLHEASEHYRKERDELAAHVERLREALKASKELAIYWIMRADKTDISEHEYRAWLTLGLQSSAMEGAREALAETPAQSIAAVRAEAGRAGFMEAMASCGKIISSPTIIAAADEYTQQLRNGRDDDG